MTDLLITGGLILDGTGNPGYRASVAIEGDRIRIIRGSAGLPVAARTIDATGLVVAPGFIDLHSHAGLMIFEDPQHLPKVAQGVTTELVGIDGNSYAPFRDRADLRRFVTFNAGLDGAPDLPYDWDGVASYLSRFDRTTSVNVAMLIGNSALRISAMGWGLEPASRAAVADMQAMLREGLQEGAFGVSSGLDYPPGSYASTEELTEVCRPAGEFGGIYHTHVRYWLGDKILDPFREAFAIGRQSGAPLHITHFYGKAAHPHGSGPLFDLLDGEARLGADVTFDTYPYEWSGSRLSIYLPQWIQAGGPDETLRRLADSACRERLHAELEEGGAGPAWRTAMDYVRVGYLARPENQRYENRTVGEIARSRGHDVADTLMDLLLAEELRPAYVAVGPVGTSLLRFLKHPLGLVGTDSTFNGDKPSPRTYGSYPRILGQFVRDEKLMSLPEAIRKITSFPAQRLGLTERGLLRDGLFADVVIFDPETIRARATYDDPRQLSTGIEYVLVNGELVLDRGVHTGRLPGRALRR